jgi:hypothetical protein
MERCDFVAPASSRPGVSRHHEKGKPMNRFLGVAIALGIGSGTAIGAATHHMALWVSIGAALSIAIALVMGKRSPKS